VLNVKFDSGFVFGAPKRERKTLLVGMRDRELTIAAPGAAGAKAPFVEHTHRIEGIRDR
jgi:hypothetical protein